MAYRTFNHGKGHITHVCLRMYAVITKSDIVKLDLQSKSAIFGKKVLSQMWLPNGEYL